VTEDSQAEGVVEASLDALDSTGEVVQRKARRTLRETMRLRQPEFRYGELLVLLLVTFVFNGAVTRQNRWHSIIFVALESLTLLFALLASKARPLTIRIAVIVSALAFLGAAFQLGTHSNTARAASSILNVLLVIVAPLVVVRAIIRRRVVDVRTVLASLCLYVMIGTFFAMVFIAVQSTTGVPFFKQNAHAAPSDFSYFSFVTLTTVGYGDLTAAHSLGRTLAAFEAMFGQLYLVSVVAVLVSNMGPIFSSRKGGDADDDDDADD
jgi:Ion channel